MVKRRDVGSGGLSALLVGVPLALCSVAAHAALMVTSPNQVFTQSFDTLAVTGSPSPSDPVAWTNDSTLPGWSLFRQPAPGAALTEYRAGAGTDNTGSFYSFGNAGSAERALGGIGSGGAYWSAPATGAIAGWIAVAFTNSSGGALQGFAVSFDGDQWLNGGNTSAQTLAFEYGFGASFTTVASWIDPGAAFDFTSPTTGATAGALNGNAAANRVGGIGGLVGTTWAVSDTLWLRWVERNDTGNDHALAIDNFSLTAVPEPASLALVGLALAALALLRRRRHSL